MKRKVVIGTRGSKLALWQANFIRQELEDLHSGLEVEIQIIQTTGDRMQNIPLSQIGGKGLFTKEIEEEMLAGRVDLAIHSLKDVPTELPEGLELAVITKRAHPGDGFVSNRYSSIEELPQKARIGTSSLRRSAQLLHFRPDLEILPLRGNVDTRLRKLDEGEMDGIVLAVSGMTRLGLEERITEILPYEACLPAVGQGALALEIRSEDDETRNLIAPLHDLKTYAEVTGERAFLRYLEGNCQVPFGVFGQVSGQEMILEAAILSVDGKTCIRDQISGSPEEAEEIGIRLAKLLADQGGREILESLVESK